MHRTVALLLMSFLLVKADSGDLDSLIDNINGNSNHNPRPITTNLNPSVGSPDEVITCTTEHGDEGECVQYYLCNDNNTINTDGSGIIDIRIMGACSYLEVCCKAADRAEHPILPNQPGGYNPNQPGGYNPNQQPGGYNPNQQPGGYNPNQPGGQPQPGGHPNQQPGGHPTDGGYNPNQQPGGHPNQPGGLPNQPGGYPNQPGGQPGGHPGDGHQNPQPGGGQPGHPTGPGYNPGLDSKSLGCGIRNENGVGFRIKGDKDNEAQFGEFAWMVAILTEEPSNQQGTKLNVYLCGGSLIHPKVVLTAAHCVVGNSKGGQKKFKVRAGEWDTQTKKEILPHQDRGVAKVIRHEHYYAGGLFNDIALLILESEFDEAENVGVVCLPPAGSKPPLTKCLASGWGKDVFGKEGRYQVILKKVELPIVEHGKCQKALRKTRLGARFELHKSFTCAGGEAGKDTCKGDGGSPLVCPIPERPDRYMQTGIVAWGIGCGENSTPGVYVNVAYLREWIDDQMIYNDIDLSPYHHY